MSVKWNAATRYSAHPFTTKTGARVHFFCLNYPRIRGWYQARVHPFSSGNGKGDHKTIYFSTYPGRQCWSLPPTRTMLMFGLVKHRRSQCWCLTPVKKSMDLGSAMKCKIIIHVFIMPISQHVGPLELNLKPTRSYRYWISGQETNQGTLFANILSEFTGKTWDLKRFGNMPLPEAHATD